MSDSLRLQRKIRKRLCQRMPDLGSPQRGNLAWMMSGLHLAQHVHLSKIAERRVGAAPRWSRARPSKCAASWPTRPLTEALTRKPCKRCWPGGFFRPPPQAKVRILMDTVELSGRRQVLMAALAYRRRALPLRGPVRRRTVRLRTGVSGAEEQISLLQALSEEALSGQVPEGFLEGLPDGAEVIVVGDGAFHSTDLMRYITDRGWHFRLRLHADTYVRLAGEEDWRELRELAPEEGERRYLHSVYLTKDKAYGPVNLALCHKAGEDDPWLIATDQKAGYPALRTYSRQRRNFCDWIEQLFADFEGGGFHLKP